MLETTTVIKAVPEAEANNLIVFADIERGGHIVEPSNSFVTVGCKFTKNSSESGRRTAGAFIHVPKSHLPEMVESIQKFIKENNIK